MILFLKRRVYKRKKIQFIITLSSVESTLSNLPQLPQVRPLAVPPATDESFGRATFESVIPGRFFKISVVPPSKE